MSATSDQRVLRSYDAVYTREGTNFSEQSGTTDTLTAAESGLKMLYNSTSATTVTLPATVLGYCFHIEAGVEGMASLAVSPAAADKIVGNGEAGVDNKDITITSPSMGDYVKLVGDGADGYYVMESRGNWVAES